MIPYWTSLITELFDRPYAFLWHEIVDSRYAEADFVTDDRQHYTVTFNYYEDEKWWVVEFLMNDDVIGDHGLLTGTGDSLKVMATVCQIVKDFIQKKHLEDKPPIAMKKSYATTLLTFAGTTPAHNRFYTSLMGYINSSAQPLPGFVGYAQRTNTRSDAGFIIMAANRPKQKQISQDYAVVPPRKVRPATNRDEY